jgi:hypothetical protein
MSPDLALTFGQYTRSGTFVEVPQSTFPFLSFPASGSGIVSSVPEPLAGVLVLLGAGHFRRPTAP